MIVTMGWFFLSSCSENKKNIVPLLQASPVPNHYGWVVSPFSGEILDARGLRPGLVVTDSSDIQLRRFIIPWVEPSNNPNNMPCAIKAPGSSGYLLNPFTHRLVDARDLPPLTPIQDPISREFFLTPPEKSRLSPTHCAP